MTAPVAAGRKPAITIARSEHRRLLAFATGLEARDPHLAENLFVELERARVVDDHRIADSVVRMGSSVRYEADGDARTVILVYPAEADISLGRISVLTPVGTALLGLSPGQSIGWIDRGGRRHQLTIVSVENHAEVTTATGNGGAPR